jgi:predicted nucleotidyltransferase component of viral defense system
MELEQLNSFYLVGGTALALQIGHRVSIDLDLFTEVSFDKAAVLDVLNDHFDSVVLESEGTSMLVTSINDVKVDFVKMAYPILFTPLEVEGVRMLDMRDIAPMKLKAIVQRGSKKDFYDIFFLLNYLSLGEMLTLFMKKFKQEEIFHVIKSLTYFDDAEQYADPMMFDRTVTWGAVKKAMITATKDLL